MDNINEKSSGDSQSLSAIMDAFSDSGDTSSPEESGSDTLNLNQLRKMEEPEDAEFKEVEEEAEVEAAPAESAEAEPEAETEEEAPVEEDEKAPEPEVKVLEQPGEVKFKTKNVKLLVDGKESTIPNNAIIEIAVDGGIKKLHLQEVMNRAAGDVSVQARITEVEEIRKKNEADFQATREQMNEEWEERTKVVERTNETIKRICQIATEGKPEELLIYAARKTGQPIDTVIKNFVGDIKKYATSFAELSDPDVDRWVKSLSVIKDRQEIDEEKQVIESDKASKAAKAEAAKFEANTRAIMAERDVSELEFREVVADLNKNSIDFSAKDPEGRVIEVLDYVHESRILKTAEEISPALLKDVELLQGIYDYTKVRNIRKKSDILAIVKGFAEEEDKKEQARIAEDLSRKARKNGAPPEKKNKANEKVDVDEAVMSIGGFLRQSRGY